MFYKGDIVELIEADSDVPDELELNRVRLKRVKPFRLIILRRMDEEQYLVAACDESSAGSQLSLETNQGQLFAKTLSFYPIDSDSLRLCRNLYFSSNKAQVVAALYDNHYEQLEIRKRQIMEQNERRRHRIALRKENRKRKKEKARQRTIAKRERKKNAELERRQLEEEYKNEYELAIISNDKSRMRQIESIVGYAPNYREKNPAKRKSGCYVASPKPYQGGRFSPK